jgi:hypothetical protein
MTEGYGGAEREAQRAASDVCYGGVHERVGVVVVKIVRSLSGLRRVSAGSGAHVSGGDAQGGNRGGGEDGDAACFTWMFPR